MKNSTKNFSQIAQVIGLNDDEEAIYQTMLELDSVSVRKIADHSGINRGAVYEALKSLQAQGLVSRRHQGARDYFVAESPEKLFNLLKDKRKELWEAQVMAKKVVPELTSKVVRSSGSPLVKYFEDDEGVVSILNDVLHTCVQLDNLEYCVYSSRPLRQYLYRKFPNFTAKRIREGINVKVIAIGEGGEKVEYSDRKWLNDAQAEAASSYTIIYGNKVAHIAISETRIPYGVVVEDAGVASMQRLLFEQLWSKL